MHTLPVCRNNAGPLHWCAELTILSDHDGLVGVPRVHPLGHVVDALGHNVQPGGGALAADGLASGAHVRLGDGAVSIGVLLPGCGGVPLAHKGGRVEVQANKVGGVLELRQLVGGEGGHAGAEGLLHGGGVAALEDGVGKPALEIMKHPSDEKWSAGGSWTS